MPGPRTYDFQPVQSGLDAFLSGAGEGFGAIDNALRQRKVRQQQDEAHRVNVEAVQAEQARRNIEAGVSVVRPDPITDARQQVSGIRAKIGALLSGGTPQPTPTYAKTGLSEKEILANQREAGDTQRTGMTNATTLEATRIREQGDASRHAATLSEDKRYHDMWAADQNADRGMRREEFSKTMRSQETRDLRDYGQQLNAEIESLRREAADKNGIMQQVGGDADPTKAYQARQRELRTRIGQLREEQKAVNEAMNRRAIGKQLARPTTVTTRATSVGLPSLEEDLQAAMRPR